MKRLLIKTMLIAWAMLGAASAWSADFVTVESRSLGDGWFEYRVTLAEDPYFENALIGAVSIAFPGRSEYGADPADWTSDATDPDTALWTFDTQQTQARPYERIFTVRSSLTGFKTIDQAVRVTYLATPRSDLEHEHSPALSGFGRLRGVVPCPPGEADGSPVSHLASISLREDLRITSLTVVGGIPTGLSFNWTYDSTVRLEASFDLKEWTPVTTIVGVAGETMWTATEPLETSGNYFRLVLLTSGQAP